MLIHINRERFDRIMAEGWHFSPLSKQVIDYKGIDHHYHLLEGEHGVCPMCDAEFDSAQVNSPIELEMLKLREMQAN